jgi:two-component system, cell cycle sensor histidine kinase and response regulator CckA
VTPDEIMTIVREQGFDTVYDNSADAMYVLSPTGKFLSGNRALLERLGLTLDELLGMTFTPTVEAGSLATVTRGFEKALEGERSQYIATGIRADGTEFHSDVANVPFIHNDEVVAIIGVAHDIDQIASETRVRRELERRWQVTLDAITDGLFFLDKDWRFTYVNPRACEIVGMPEHELVGRSIWTLFPESRDSPFGVAYRAAAEQQRTVTIREHYAPLGVWLQSTAYPTDNGVAVYARDVSEEERTREHLRASDRRLKAQAALLDVATDAILVRGLDNSIRYWNDSARRIYGWSEAEARASSVRDLLYADPEEFDVATATTIRDGSWTGVLEQRNRAGELVIADCRWSLVLDEAGQPEAIFAVNSDITERRRIEEGRQREERMDGLGTLASGIAHDLNNVLTPMLMSVQLLARTETDPSNLEVLAVIEASARRGASMIKQVLAFARGAETKRQRVHTRRLLGDIEAFCREALPRTIEVTTSVDAAVHDVSGDPTQLLQVLVNLVTNASDAMPDGGSLLISARNVEQTGTPGTSETMVCIEVVDTGVGMDLATRKRIYEPFFTTKGVGEGTGLGLATSAAIVNGLGGSIDVTSQPGKGTRFRIELPARTAIEHFASAPSSSDARLAPEQGHERLVLVVDDEVAIRTSTRRVLEEFGFRTTGAQGGAEALDLLDELTDSVALVITDLRMPGIDGHQLATTIGERYPTLPVVVTSGAIATADDLPPGVRPPFLPKPYTTSQLLGVIDNALRSADNGVHD